MRHIILFLILFSIIISSCVTQKRCYSKFPPTTSTTTNTTVRDSIVYRDKLVEVKIPGKTVRDSVPIPCPPPPPSYVPDTARAETDYASAKAWFDYPNIKIELEQKTSVLQVRLDSAIKESYHWESEYKKERVVLPPVRYIPAICKWAVGLWIVAIIAGIVFVTLRFRPGITKTLNDLLTNINKKENAS